MPLLAVPGMGGTQPPSAPQEGAGATVPASSSQQAPHTCPERLPVRSLFTGGFTCQGRAASQSPAGAWRRPALVGFILALAGEAGSRQCEELIGAVRGTAAPGGQYELPDPVLWLHQPPLSSPALPGRHRLCVGRSLL